MKKYQIVIAIIVLLFLSFAVSNQVSEGNETCISNTEEIIEVVKVAKKENFKIGNKNPIYAQKYISKHTKVAIEEQRVKNVPASLKLAQGVIESDYGRSTAARKANAHFCIKGKNSLSIKVYDKKEKSKSSYKGYKTSWWSFRDHSTLLNNDNYSWVLNDLTYNNYIINIQKTNLWRKNHKKLKLKPLDTIWRYSWNRLEKYEKVAHGVHVSGYATDINYAKKLINIIKKYKLYKLDKT